MRESMEKKSIHSTPMISKIESEAMKFRTLVNHIKGNQKKNMCDSPFQLQSDLELSNIEHRSEHFEKNSFELQLQADLTVRKNAFTMAPISSKNGEGGIRDVGDKGLKYKPRSSKNGRDDIRIRNLGQSHKKIVESLQKRRHQSEDKSINKQQISQAFNTEMQRMINPQAQPKFISNKFKRSRATIFTPNVKEAVDNSFGDISRRNSFHTERPFQQRNPNQKDNFLQIEGKDLLQYLLRLFEESFPHGDSIPNQIYEFFINICHNFGVQDFFQEPLIKRYRNCVYFGEKLPKNPMNSYMGFVWYYRKALYYGQFSKGRKHGYGVEIDIEESGKETIWKGNFQNGKKTGYFQMSSPQMQFNGSMVNSYFDGEGELKVKGKSVYKGAFQAGMKQGYGFETFLNNKAMTYKGEYIDGKFDGNGVLEGPNYFYKGEFRSNKPHGEGFERTDEFQYVGAFKNGKKDGKGTLKMRTGEVYQGLFRDGRIVGEQKINSYQQNQYIKKIPIQSFSRNREQASLSPSRNLPESTSLKLELNSLQSSPHKSTASPRTDFKNENSRIRLSKYLSKNLAALDEQNEEVGTIEHPNQIYNMRSEKNKNYSEFRLQKVQNQKQRARKMYGMEENDEDEPLQSRVASINYH